MFADDTTTFGETKEIDGGVQKAKEVMNKFEERNNDDKQDLLQFGSNEADEIRMIGAGSDRKQTLIRERRRSMCGKWKFVRCRHTKLEHQRDQFTAIQYGPLLQMHLE